MGIMRYQMRGQYFVIDYSSESNEILLMVVGYEEYEHLVYDLELGHITHKTFDARAIEHGFTDR